MSTDLEPQNKSPDKFQLKQVGSSQEFGNYDVTAGESRLGRLYVLPCTEQTLIASGIEKQWFITHAEGNFVVSGYLNKAGEWSLSDQQSLEPASNYSNQSDILSTVFSDSYVHQVQKQIQNQTQTELIQPEQVQLNQKELEQSVQLGSQLQLEVQSELQFNSREVPPNSLEPTSIVEIDKLSSNKSSGEGNADNDNSDDNGKQGISISKNESAVLLGFPGVKELLNSSSAKSRDLENVDAVPREGENLESEQVEALTAQQFALNIKATERANDEFLSVQQTAQQRLVELALNLLSQDERDEQELEDLDWAFSIDPKRHMFRLCDRTDGHTVLRATSEGDVLEPLSLEDARKFSLVRSSSFSPSQAREQERGIQEGPQEPSEEMLEESLQESQKSSIVSAPPEQAKPELRPELQIDKPKKGLDL